MEEFSVVPIEVRCRPLHVNRAELSKVIVSFIRQRHAVVRPGEVLSLATASSLITSTVESLRVCDVYCPQLGVAADRADYTLMMYSLCTGEHSNGGGGGGVLLNSSSSCAEVDGDDGTELPACSVLSLPHVSLEGLWETLFYGETQNESASLKRDLLQYMRTAIIFSRAGVNPHVISWNRLLLLHGPPGTGKTSLCKALAHKLSIRLNEMFSTAQLIEINAHSLFSRWFSESGKHVMHLFQEIHSVAERPDSLLCVLVDEVESLAAARQSAMKGNEPSDAIRVVNTLLTQLDSLQRRHNVVVLTTSNITGAIDVAFIDRADKKIFIGTPGFQARLELMRASTEEMIRRGLVVLTSSSSLLSCSDGAACSGEFVAHEKTLCSRAVLQLEAIARECEGFSGRAMKKLPFLAYGEHARGGAEIGASHAISFAAFVNGLQTAVVAEKSAREAMRAP